MEAFEYTALPARVVFGVGTLPRVADKMNAMGCKRALVLSDPHHASVGATRLMQALGEKAVHLSADAVMHTPADVTERGMGAHSGPQIHIDADEIAAIGDFSQINNGSIGGRENPPDFGNG